VLLPFVSAEKRTPIDHLAIEDLSSLATRRFLDHVEKTRYCCGATRNQRLAAIHSLAKFIATRGPQHLAWCADLRSVPYKKTTQRVIDYLDKQEMDALLEAPNRRTRQGARDYALLLFLYNTGARADEAAQLCVADLTLVGTAAVRILGKGNKTRACPLWARTVAVLKPLVAGLRATDPVFRGRRNERLTRFGIYNIVKVDGEVRLSHQPFAECKTSQPSYHSTHIGRPSPTSGRRPQHHTGVVGPRVPGYDEHLCRGTLFCGHNILANTT
jgi:integrase/recombinase XerD